MVAIQDNVESTAPLYDIFLSHNSLDKPVVELIGGRLQSAGFNPFLDKWHLIPGKPFQPELADALNASKCVAVFFGPSGSSPWHNEEMQFALNKAVRTRDDYRLIPVLLPGSDPSQIDGFVALRTWVDFRSGADDELAFQRLVAGIKGVAPDLGDQVFELPDEPRPYRGIQPFEGAQHEMYYGRHSEIQRLTNRLKTERFIAVVGASGSGKSSLVRAGLYTDSAQEDLPGIRNWQRIIFTPGKDPLLQLAANLVAHLPEIHRAELMGKFITDFTVSARGLITALATLFPNREQPVLLVADQFEELVTQGPATEAGRAEWHARNASFAANLRTAIDDGPEWLRVVITIRADFLDEFVKGDIAEFRLLLERRQFWIATMTDEDIREAIARPVAARGAFLEKGLVERILTEMHGQPTALPLLEEALDILWQKRRGPWLTHQAYDKIGGVSGALADKATRIFNSLSKSQQALARRIFLKLIQLGEGARDTRRRVSFADLMTTEDDPAEFRFVLEKFLEPGARLLTLSSTENLEKTNQTSQTVEVTHEALIEHWGMLKEWLGKGRDDIRLDQRLSEAAKRWEEEADRPNGKPNGLLWRPPDLDLGREYAQRTQGLTKRQLRFLDRSGRAETARKRRIWLVVIGLFLAVAAFGIIYPITIAQPIVWERISQPDGTEQFTFKKFLPVHEIAINKADPSLILYLGENADWNSLKQSISPQLEDTYLSEFRERVVSKLKMAHAAVPVGRVKFEIIENETNVRGAGTMEIAAAMNQNGYPQFVRSFRFKGKAKAETGSASKTTETPPTLFDGDEETVFDLGEYAEYLASNNLLEPDDKITGSVEDLVAGTTTNVAFQMDDLLTDGYTARDYYGSQYKIFTAVDREDFRIGDTTLKERQNDREFWNTITKTEDWISYQPPKRQSVGGGLDSKPETVVEAMPVGSDVKSLHTALAGLPEWTNGNDEMLDSTLISTSTPVGRADVLRLDWSETPQGTGEMELQDSEWLIHLSGASAWQRIALPATDVVGLWSLENDGKSAILLSGEHGFYRTKDGGRTWEEANFNETGFTNGKNVKLFVVNGTSGTFALIDRGTAAGDGENPLFRLKSRGLIERWRTGLIQLLR